MDRRSALKTYSLAMLGLSAPGMAWAVDSGVRSSTKKHIDQIPAHFPNIAPATILEVVGKSHFDLTRVKELVDQRPELSRSVWEWRFGDFESAIGAASHVGRRDIALYLMAQGASPTIFTFAMLGQMQVVKAMVEASPEIQQVLGPHGISLLDHAYAGERMKGDMNPTEVGNLAATIDYLRGLGNANGEKYIEVSEAEQQKYLGNYRYGEGEKEGFTIGVNMRKLLSLGVIGESGGAIYKIGDNKFMYNGSPSVTIAFGLENDQVKSLILTAPDATVFAEKIS